METAAVIIEVVSSFFGIIVVVAVIGKLAQKLSKYE